MPNKLAIMVINVHIIYFSYNLDDFLLVDGRNNKSTKIIGNRSKYNWIGDSPLGIANNADVERKPKE